VSEKVLSRTSQNIGAQEFSLDYIGSHRDIQALQFSPYSLPLTPHISERLIDCRGNPVVISATMPEFIVVLVTVGSNTEGDRVARALVEERLAACVNRIPAVQSVYRWQGKVEQSAEELLVIKTRADLFAALEKRVRELHSYSVPEVIALPIVSGSETYLRWLGEQVVGGAA
jgi:periplasmic divalent cation tolerance protein